MSPNISNATNTTVLHSDSQFLVKPVIATAVRIAPNRKYRILC